MTVCVFGPSDLVVFRQWFDVLQNTPSVELDTTDYQVARRIYEMTGDRVPSSIADHLKDKP